MSCSDRGDPCIQHVHIGLSDVPCFSWCVRSAYAADVSLSQVTECVALLIHPSPVDSYILVRKLIYTYVVHSNLLRTRA